MYFSILESKNNAKIKGQLRILELKHALQNGKRVFQIYPLSSTLSFLSAHARAHARTHAPTRLHYLRIRTAARPLRRRPQRHADGLPVRRAPRHGRAGRLAAELRGILQIGTNSTVTNGAVSFAQTCVIFAKTISQTCANLRKFRANPANVAQLRPILHVPVLC